MIAFLLFCCGIFFIDTDLESRWNVFYILEVQHYLVYFFFGIFFFRFELYKYIENIGILLVLVLLYAACYYFSLGLLTSIVGIFMMCSLCLKIGQYFPNLFSSFREYIYQIYLMSLPFQTFVELILWRKLFYNEQLFFVFFALNLLSGLYLSVRTLSTQQLHEFLHTLGGAFLNLLDATTGIDGIRVDEVDRHLRTGIVQ